jgi:diguanylate cyclase (GGDEF)-like protein
MEQLRLELERARRYRHPFTILMLDLDRFKKINDTYGHLAGDEALRRFAAVLLEASRNADVVGRYGGEEFLVLLTETPISGAIAVANRLLHRLSEAQISVSVTGDILTASIGLASYPEAGTSLDALIGASDAALYEAKAKGGNAFAIRRPDGSFEVVKPALAPSQLTPPAPPVQLVPPPPVQPSMPSMQASSTPTIGEEREPEPARDTVPAATPPTSRAATQESPLVAEPVGRAAVEERVQRLERSMGELAATLERLQERLIIIGGLQRSAEERSSSQAEGAGNGDNGRLVKMLEEEKERLGGRVEQLRGELNTLVSEMEELRGIVRRNQGA